MIDNKDLLNYLNYSSECLGLKYIPREGAESSSLETLGSLEASEKLLTDFFWELGFDGSKNYDFLFLLEGSSWSQLDFESKELFLKMRAALKLKFESPAVVSNSWSLELVHEFIKNRDQLTDYILLSSDQSLLNQKNKIQLHICDQKVLVIPSLELMRKNIEWKRVAWDRLKKFIQP